jgi:uracil-DNA glycosylase
MPMWDEILRDEKQQPYFKELEQTIVKKRQVETVYPQEKDVFNALKYTPFNKVKVVIIGQDPYHGPNQAHGLSFSVQAGIKIPPSLINIFKELNRDLEVAIPSHGCLEPWARQGVLLLNSVLTVTQKKPQSHAKLGWQKYTDTIIKSLNSHNDAIVFMLWGAQAQKKSALILNPKHLILTAAHPSPLSVYRGFIGCKHFSKCNAWLQSHQREPINWELSNPY